MKKLIFTWRRRGCNPAKHGGKDCPVDRKAYEEFRDCYNPPCAGKKMDFANKIFNEVITR